MTERVTDSIGQFRPQDNVTIQYQERGGGEVVWENRIIIPQWRKPFEKSPLMPPGVSLDTSNVKPGDPESHITIRAPHIGEGVTIVRLKESGTGASALPDDVTVIVDATALTRKYRNQSSMPTSKSRLVAQNTAG